MSNFFDELAIKFCNIETKIEHKKTRINNLYDDQKEILNAKFNIENLTEKYSKELNNQRQSLFNQIKLDRNFEINNKKFKKKVFKFCLNNFIY
jgi:hypothetical protein